MLLEGVSGRVPRGPNAIQRSSNSLDDTAAHLFCTFAQV
jgi:hypothetical protein